MLQHFNVLRKQLINGKGIFELPYKKVFLERVLRLEKSVEEVMPDGKNLKTEHFTEAELIETIAAVSVINWRLQPDHTRPDDLVTFIFSFLKLKK